MYINYNIFKYNPRRTNNRFITSQCYFYPVTELIIRTSSNRKRRIIVYGLVARYGPESVASRATG